MPATGGWRTDRSTWFASNGRHRRTRLGSTFERRLPFVLAIVFLVGISLAAEFRSYASADTGFLLDAAGRVLDGARLYVDVVEINPPLIIALNVAVVWAARLLHLPEILLYRIVFTVALLGSLWLSAVLLRSVLLLEVRARRLLLLALAFVLFPLAQSDFGEREHLALALLVPFVLVAAARLAGRQITEARAFSIGLLAGSAFALKPHFLILWPLFEVLLRTRGRVPPRALLPESVAVAAFVVGYVALIAVVAPAYFELVRLLAVPYSRFLYDPFYRLLVTGPGAVLTLFALLAFIALRPHARHPALWTTVAMATAGCLVAGAAQQKGLRYHFYPALGLATLTLALVQVDSFAPTHSRVRAVYRALVAGVLAATVAAVCVGRTAVALGWADGSRPRSIRAVGGTGAYPRAGSGSVRDVVPHRVRVSTDQLQRSPLSLAVSSPLDPGRGVPGCAEESAAAALS